MTDSPLSSPAPISALIAYDGSDEARRAVQYAATLLNVGHVDIVTAYQSTHRLAAMSSGAPGVTVADLTVDNATGGDPAADEAAHTCREGAELASSCGLSCHAHLVECTTSIWAAIVDAANQLRPDVIVTGTRGQGGLKGFLQSSVSDSVVQHAGLPVLIVPPADTSVL